MRGDCIACDALFTLLWFYLVVQTAKHEVFGLVGEILRADVLIARDHL